MNILTIIWRTLTTRSPKIRDLWISRVDGKTEVSVIGTRNHQITFVGHDEMKRTLDESEFVCFWKPKRV